MYLKVQTQGWSKPFVTYYIFCARSKSPSLYTEKNCLFSGETFESNIKQRWYGADSIISPAAPVELRALMRALRTINEVWCTRLCTRLRTDTPGEFRGDTVAFCIGVFAFTHARFQVFSQIKALVL